MSRTERRPQRYTRSSTTSVTQLLSDSCSSLLARLTTRRDEPTVRQRIEERHERRCLEEAARQRKADERTRLLDDPPLGTTRSRLEDKYSDVLEKYVRRKKDAARASTPAEGKLGLSKSATTASVLLSEKAYPFVSARVLSPRAKTPFRATESVVRPSRGMRLREQVELSVVPHVAQRQRRSRAELTERPALKLCPIDIETEMPVMATRRLKAEDATPSESRESLRHNKEISVYRVTRRLKEVDASKSEVPENSRRAKERSPMREIKSKVSSPVDPVIQERETRRKEIQSLINKYVMLDEAYGKLGKSMTREKTLKAAGTQTSSVSVRQPIVPVPVPVKPMRIPAAVSRRTCG